MLYSPSFSKLIVSFAICCSVVACAQSLYIPAPENVHDVNSIGQLTAGRKLYIRKCGSCHNLYLPQKFTREKWEHEMIEMQVEAKISDHEASLILDYLTSYKSPATDAE